MDAKAVAAALTAALVGSELVVREDVSHGASPIGAEYLVLTDANGREFELMVKSKVTPVAPHYHVAFPDGTERTFLTRQKFVGWQILETTDSSEYALRTCHQAACRPAR